LSNKKIPFYAGWRREWGIPAMKSGKRGRAGRKRRNFAIKNPKSFWQNIKIAVGLDR
jgi:hypothetical protein